jgi:hypothetical protein
MIIHELLAEKPTEEKRLERRRRWSGGIILKLMKERNWVWGRNWITSAQNRDQLRAFVNTAMNA